MSRSELPDAFNISAEYADGELPADYNMAPTKEAPAALARKPRMRAGFPQDLIELIEQREHGA